MKNNVHGGRKAFLQTALRLQKFTQHLQVQVSPTPFTSPKINYLDFYGGASLLVDYKGELRVIDRRYQYN